MEKNVGRLDAMIRMTGGLLGLAYGIGKMGRKPYRTPWLLMGFSALLIAEGMTRFCPMYRALGINTGSVKKREQLLDKLGKMGINAVMKKVTGKDNQKAESAPSMQEEPASGHSARAEKTDSHGLASEDRQIESAVREFVTANADEAKDTVDASKSNEHLSPLYS